MGIPEQLVDDSFLCHIGFWTLNTDLYILRSNNWMQCLVPHPEPQVFGIDGMMPNGWELQYMDSLAITIPVCMSKPVFAVGCTLCLEVVWNMKVAPLASLLCISHVNKAA